MITYSVRVPSSRSCCQANAPRGSLPRESTRPVILLRVSWATPPGWCGPLNTGSGQCAVTIFAPGQRRVMTSRAGPSVRSKRVQFLFVSCIPRIVGSISLYRSKVAPSSACVAVCRVLILCETSRMSQLSYICVVTVIQLSYISVVTVLQLCYDCVTTVLPLCYD